MILAVLVILEISGMQAVSMFIGSLTSSSLPSVFLSFGLVNLAAFYVLFYFVV